MDCVQVTHQGERQFSFMAQCYGAFLYEKLTQHIIFLLEWAFEPKLSEYYTTCI